MLLADSLVGFGTSAAVGSNVTSGGVLGTVALLGWFASLARGRMPQGMRDLAAYAIGYSAQVNGFVLLLTDRYPNSDPAIYDSANVYRDDPIRVPVDDDLRRSRLTVFFRLLLATPHFVWFLLWTVLALFAWIANWFATLISGRSPSALHRFLSAYLRYQIHLYAFLQLVANPFPGFAGKPGTYPVDVEIEPPLRQNRWVTAFRAPLAVPAFLIASALEHQRLRGRDAELVLRARSRPRAEGASQPRRDGASLLRPDAGYWYLLTDRYPYSGPSSGWQLRLNPAPPPGAPESRIRPDGVKR